MHRFTIVKNNKSMVVCNTGEIIVYRLNKYQLNDIKYIVYIIKILRICSLII